MSESESDRISIRLGVIASAASGSRIDGDDDPRSHCDNTTLSKPLWFGWSNSALLIGEEVNEVSKSDQMTCSTGD